MTKAALARTGHVIVTGGTGYIGARVVRLALDMGCAVTVLSRTMAGVPAGARHLAWALGEPLPAAALLAAVPGESQAVIHLAHDWSNQGGEDGLNAGGTRALLESGQALGIGRFVFVSSQSAREDAPNIYGRVKWRLEQLLAREGEVAARVGLVYGGPLQGMFGMLCGLVTRAPVLPMIDPWRLVQPIHVDEVALGLLRLADRGGSGWMGLAAAEGLAFGDFLTSLAKAVAGKRLPILPVPLRAALFGAAVAARVPFAPTVDRERILGLAGTRPMVCAADLETLGLQLMSLADGLRGEPAARMAVLREGRLLLSYVLRAPPCGALLRRYARAVELQDEGALALPGSLRAPGMLRLREPLSAAAPLARRLRLASALAEASPEGELRLRHGSRAGRLAWVGLQGALDAGLLLPRLVFGLRRG